MCVLHCFLEDRDEHICIVASIHLSSEEDTASFDDVVLFRTEAMDTKYLSVDVPCCDARRVCHMRWDVEVERHGFFVQ